MSTPGTAPEGGSFPLPRNFGDYELLAEIGRGGMGVIYRARQCCLNRLCAVKMLHLEGTFIGPEAEEALQAEAAAAARLDHPNIVGIYEVGRAEGRLFFSMELVEGVSLAEYTRERVLDAREIARIAAGIADAMAYAHEAGVWHHDLKPANVLIDRQGEPQVTDFGLARRVDDARRVDPGQGAGSPNFLAPEQASSRFGEPGPRTDVFGLGAILYFLLTDRAPFRGETLADTLRAVLGTDPVRPRALRTGVPEELEVICLRCLEKRPSRRYPSPADVAEELHRFLRHEPILARPVGPVERLRKWRRRHPAIAALSATILALLVLLTAGAVAAAVRLDRARQRATDNESRAWRNLYAADMALAFEALSAGNLPRVRTLLEPYRPAAGGGVRPGWEWAFLQAMSQGDAEREGGPTGGEVIDLQVFPDGRRLIVSDATGVQVWDAESGTSEPRREVRSGGNPMILLDAAGRELAVVDRPAGQTNSVVRLLDLATGRTNAQWTLPGFYALRRPGSGGDSVWMSGSSEALEVDRRDGRVIRRVPFPGLAGQSSVAFSDGPGRVAVGIESGEIVVLDPVSGRETARFPGHERPALFPTSALVLAFSPDGRWLASGASDGCVRLWDLAAGQPGPVMRGHADLVVGLAYSPDGRRLVSAGRDSHVNVWRVPEGALEVRQAGGSGLVRVVRFLPDGRRFATGGQDRRWRIWNGINRPRFDEQRRFPTGLQGLELLPDGEHAAFRTSGREFGVLRLADGAVVFREAGRTNALAGDIFLAAPPSGQAGWYLADGRIEVGRLGEAAARSVREPDWVPVPPSSLTGVDWASGGGLLAVTDSVNGARVFRADTLERVARLPVRGAISARFAPDGGSLVVNRSLAPPVLWWFREDRRVELTSSGSQRQTAEFSRDGRWLALAGLDGTAQLFDARSGQVRSELNSRAGGLIALAFSQDDTRLIGGGLDGVVGVWDLETGRELGALKLHEQPVTSLAFGRDGRLLTLGMDAARWWPARGPGR